MDTDEAPETTPRPLKARSRREGTPQPSATTTLRASQRLKGMLLYLLTTQVTK